MKAVLCGVLVLLAAVAAPASAEQALRGRSQDRKITEVVKLLQTMLEKSKADGDSERDLYAKYKCYCDTNEAAKKAEIESLTEEIAVLEAKIEELQAANAQLSKEVAKLDADMKQNQKDRDEATAIRNKEHEDFLAQESDLVAAIDQMTQAIQVLSEIGADQTLNTATGHTQYMAGAGLLKLKASVKTALVAASAFVSQGQVQRLESFLQAPFTGTYSARSGEVVGILKDMKDTFKANLAAAREAEARAQAAFDRFIAEMTRAYNEMQASFNAKQGQLSANDGDLAAKRSQLEAAELQKAEAEDFLAKLLDMCSAKKKQYGERVALRSQEEAALSEAIAILNSDAAFATFGTVSATSVGFFQKKSTIRRHRQAAAADPRQRAAGFLQAAAKAQGTPLLGRIAAMLQANNPFQTVLNEIEKMLAINEAEGKADAEQKKWCEDERQETNAGIAAAAARIAGLEAAIGELDAAINDPSTGLLVQIQGTEDELQANHESQVSETEDRREDNTAYQRDIANLVEAEALIAQAIKVLRTYYSKIVEGDFMQVGKDDPAPPATWEDKYKGQSESAAGSNGAIGMLEFILQNTKAEETQAHTDEASAQHAYEDSMQQLKDSEAALQGALASLKLQLAETEKNLQMKREDLEKTQAEKAALEAYLLKIKPGCDFIAAHFDARATSRGQEMQALKDAVRMLKQTPAYKEAVEAQHQEDLANANCQEQCTRNEDHVDCKACLAKTSVPGFCAGHPATEGC